MPPRLPSPRALTIGLVPGDGIGPEVIREGVKVLHAVEAAVDGLAFRMRDYRVGADEYRRGGDPLPTEAFEGLRQCDAILFGAAGLPDVRWPSGVEMAPQIDLRGRLDLYCGLRPIYLYHPQDTPLKNRSAGRIDLLIVRESTEGLFFSRHQRPPRDADTVDDVLRVTRARSARVFRAAFREATRRRGQLTLVDKANILPSMALFRRVFDEVGEEFPSVRTERIYVDAAALFMVQRPDRFDVLVTENMFGDILSDLAAGLVGGMGMAPSADIGDRHAVFQPSHGSAPDIAGRSLANPVATIVSAAMMLEWLSTPESTRGARIIRDAVSRTLAHPDLRTPDLGGILTTAEMGDRVADAVQPQEPSGG